MAKVFTYEQLSEHTTESDLWMTIRGKVYNVTKFIQDHPGGEEVLLELGGQDATEPYDDIGHSENADNILEKYLIGDLDKSSTKPEKIEQKQQFTTKPESSFSAVPIVIVALGIFAYLLYTYYLK